LAARDRGEVGPRATHDNATRAVYLSRTHQEDAMQIRTWSRVPALAFVIATATGCAGMPMGGGTSVDVKMEPRSGSVTAGTIALREQAGAVVARVRLNGLAPNSEHGFHVHEKGDCSAPDATSAGPHFNPGAAPHGRPGSGTHHAGDLQNLRADAQGLVNAEVRLDGLTLAAGANSIAGRALVVHRDPDDYASQPAGNSGPRISCGVIPAAR
jgi:Cu-Zn family superoxide dismutase